MFDSNRGKQGFIEQSHNENYSVIKKLRKNLEVLTQNRSKELTLTYHELIKLINEIDEIIDDSHKNKNKLLELQDKIINNKDEITIDLDYGGFDEEY